MSLTDLWRQANRKDLTNRSVKTDGQEEGEGLTNGSIDKVRKRAKEKASRDLTNRSLGTDRERRSAKQVSEDKRDEGG